MADYISVLRKDGVGWSYIYIHFSSKMVVRKEWLDAASLILVAGSPKTNIPLAKK